MIDFTPGAVLSDDEFEEIDADHQVTRVYTTATQPTSGEAFTDPTEGQSLELVDGTHVFTCQPDDARETGYERVFVRAIKSQEDLVALAADEIGHQSQQVAAASHFNFDLDKFTGWNTDVIAALPEMFWFRIEHADQEFANALEIKLSETDPHYRTLKRFFDNPNSEEFADHRKDIEDLASFAFLYDN